MTLYARIITLAAVLVALAVGAQAQTPEIDALRARAEQGVAEAQWGLGNMYANGHGVPQDDAEAVRWCRLAAAQGDVRAQFDLGGMYEEGRGVPQDYAEAVRWTRLSADQGRAGSQSSLGLMYANGEVVPLDYVQAHMWFNLAASQQTYSLREIAREARDRTARLMTPAQIAEAQRLARDWTAAHPRDP